MSLFDFGRMLSFNTVTDALNVFNENILVPTGNYGISRTAMPQISDQRKFAAFMKTKFNVDTQFKQTRRVGDIHLLQNEINKAKILKLMTDIRVKVGKNFSNINDEFPPIIITSDGYVIDGSHRLVALFNVNRHARIQFTVLNIKARDFVEILNKNRTSFGAVSKFRSIHH